MAVFTSYALGILWATCSNTGEKYLLTNQDPYFANFIQKINGGKIYTLTHCRNGTKLYCLRIKKSLESEIEESGYTGRKNTDRAIPRIDNNADFVRAYIQCHSTLGLGPCKTRRGEKIKIPRLRLHGAWTLMEWMSEVIAKTVGVGVKKVQKHSNSEMGILHYQSCMEIIKICEWVLSESHSQAFETAVYLTFQNKKGPSKKGQPS